MESVESPYMLSAMTLLYLTIIVNLWVHHESNAFTDSWISSPWSSSLSSSIWDYPWHSHKYTTIQSMFVSLFTHADWEHVLSNMSLLAWTGRQLFVANKSTYRTARYPQTRQEIEQRTSSSAQYQAWTNPLSFVWIYIGSQILSTVGCRAISYWLDWSWQRQLVKNRSQWAWVWVPDSWRDIYSTVVLHPQQVLDLRLWQYTPTIGASAAVYGVVGAHVYAAIFIPNHPATMDARAQAVWLGTIAIEFSKTPFSLEQLTKLGRWSSNNTTIDEYDNIDHASHLCGFVGGVLLAALWDRFSRPRHLNLSGHSEDEYHDL
jgi:membrane associated rhomboid family serine protease